MREPHGLDTDSQVFFYEQEFYPLSSFSAFTVRIWNQTFPTAEHAYHWRKFMHLNYDAPSAQTEILHAESAHQALQLARAFEKSGLVQAAWKEERVDVMRLIIRAKHARHEYVRRKLKETGTREVIENSWRDAFWGWGENRDGQNMLGKLWMELRDRPTPPTEGR